MIIYFSTNGKGTNIAHKKINTGDLISVCLPTGLAKYAHSRGYLVDWLCINGYVAIIKQILAIPKDKVIMNTNGI